MTRHNILLYNICLIVVSAAAVPNRIHGYRHRHRKIPSTSVETFTSISAPTILEGGLESEPRRKTCADFAPDFQSGRRQLNIYRGSPTTLLLLYFEPINRVLVRTRLAQLEKIDRSFDKAGVGLVKKLCDSLSITGKTEIIHFITRISDDKKLDDKKLDDKKVENKKMDDREVDNKKVDDKVDDESERVDIIFDYDLLTIKCHPQVIAYSITVEGSDLTIKPFFHPNSVLTG
ncbi:hypothetical protein DL95DRAFT_411604 [Leptodontidium sp. 2 PMI_412]|nr:hypothetical protein DL95DRAFT_411604 [Leptodontidium sp. 2 PMI_412]